MVAADLQVLDGLSGGVQVLTQLAACGSVVVQLLHNSTILQRCSMHQFSTVHARLFYASTAIDLGISSLQN